MSKQIIVVSGGPAVGKMTVGQHLSQLTGYPLIHNHMSIDISLSIFNHYDRDLVRDIRSDITHAIALSDLSGAIFTVVLDYNLDHEDYMREFLGDLQNEDIYLFNLEASLDTCIKRNLTENRLQCKPFKRDLKKSHLQLLRDYAFDRFTLSPEDQQDYWFPSYAINNENLSADEAAQQIYELIKT